MSEPDNSLLLTAQTRYREGNLAEAEALYRQVLQPDLSYSENQRIEALSWLGLIADQLNKPGESIAYLEQLLALRPDSAETHSNMAALLCKRGRLSEAIAHQQQAIALKPEDAEVHYNLGILLYENQQIPEATTCYRQAVALNPNHANAYNNLGIALYKQNQIDEAIDCYRRAIAANPHHANAHNSLGVALFRQGQVEESLLHYQQAVALKPDYFNAYNNLGTVLQNQGKLKEAMANYQKAIELNPGYASAYDNLGTILQGWRQLDEAIVNYRKAIELDPNSANAYNNLGSALKEKGQIEAAIACCQKALELQPDHPDAHNNYGSSLVEQGEFEAAIDHFEQAIQAKADHANAHLNLGIILLLLGNYERGLPEYHWRWKTKQCPPLRYPHAFWDGSELQGKIILLTAEQGFGDTIQFVRYAPLVAQRGGQVVVACQSSLVRLLSTVPGIIRCVDRDKVDVQTHVHSPMLDLPMLLGTTLDTIPANIPYLTPADTPIALEVPPETRLKVGIAWSVNPDSSTAEKRSCPLSLFLGLLDLPGVALYSLQKVPPEADLAILQEHPRLQDLRQQLTDFADTAAAIAQLDLVITVDTAVAHLAGALGKPVWTLLAKVADWRWLREGEKTQWYPTMRLFRQIEAGNWPEVFERVAGVLQPILAQINNGEAPFSELEQWKHHPPIPLALPTPIPTPTPVPTPAPAAPPPEVAPAPAATLAFPADGFNRIKTCRHGVFLYNHNDFYIGRSLELYGEWSEGEVSLFQFFLRPGDTVVEVGANIGTHTVYFAKTVGEKGNVVAIEPQRVVFQTLCANLALNSLTNTFCYQLGLGEAPGVAKIPVLDYKKLNNFGGVSLNYETGGEQIQISTLDSFGIQFCRLLKIDVEGMELQVLRGGSETIRRCQPILYLENDRAENSAALIQYLHELGYELYWHRPPIYNPNNFLKNTQNVFGNVVSINMLGIHPSHAIKIEGLERVKVPG